MKHKSDDLWVIAHKFSVGFICAGRLKGNNFRGCRKRWLRSNRIKSNWNQKSLNFLTLLFLYPKHRLKIFRIFLVFVVVIVDLQMKLLLNNRAGYGCIIYIDGLMRSLLAIERWCGFAYDCYASELTFQRCNNTNPIICK